MAKKLNETKDYSNSKIDKIDFHWLNPIFDQSEKIKKPEEIPFEDINENDFSSDILDRIQGSLIGLALGDAVGAPTEFRPYEYLQYQPVKDIGDGGTWGLQKGQFTDDTSMALCLTNSLIYCGDFYPYDQLVRYKWWRNHGYMSSTGQCFDIGTATENAIRQFEERQKIFSENNHLTIEQMDNHENFKQFEDFDVYCSDENAAGNGSLMRLAPVPLFFFRNIFLAIEFSGRSGELTHEDPKAIDACRYYGALIASLLRGYQKKDILDPHFYQKHRKWFGEKDLHEDIVKIARGSFIHKKRGHDDGIRGKGYVVQSLEAALWAFYNDNESFEKGVLSAVNLGDDTDTTAAIYGQLAGACYGLKKLPKHWIDHLHGKEFIKTLGKWILYQGEKWEENSRENH